MRFKREHKLKIISFFLAITLWYFVVLGKPIEKDIKIPIVYKTSNSNYLVEINPSNVLLKIEATRRVLRTFPNDNLKLEINVFQYSPGIHQIRVPVEKLNLPSGVKIKEIDPNLVTLVIKKVGIKRVPVKPTYETEEKISFKKFTLLIKPSYVTIKAPMEVLVHTHYIPTQPLNLLKLKIKKEIEVNLVPPLGILSITPKKVKVIYHEKGGK